MTKHKKKEGPRNTDPGIPNVPGAVDFAVQGAPEYMFGVPSLVYGVSRNIYYWLVIHHSYL